MPISAIAPLTGSDWSRVRLGSEQVAAADRDALGTTARLVVWPPENLPRMLTAVDREIDRLDSQASRFRADSEISRALSEPGTHRISDGLAGAVMVALAAARWTGGLADPTVGRALISLGYDRDFAAIVSGGQQAIPVREPAPVPGWETVHLTGNLLTVPPGVLIDLGATAKGLGADRAARAALRQADSGGVLVSLGGDLAVAGQPPAGGWPILVADEHRQTRRERHLSTHSARERGGHDAGPMTPPRHADPATAQEIRFSRGGLATSSVTCRQWPRAGRVMHHIIDPRTGRPADSPWRTVSVAAATCAEANAAATAAIVAGHDAIGWLDAYGLPARLIGQDGSVRLTGGWPHGQGRPVTAPHTRWLRTDPKGAGCRGVPS